MLNKFKTLMILSVSLPIVYGCNDEDSNSILTNLQKNQAKWESLNSSGYEYQYQKSCFCEDSATAPRNVLVTDNQVVSLANKMTTEALRLDAYPTQTVDGLFDLIRLEESRVETLLVEYDDETGYPTMISVDPNLQIADDEYTINNSLLQLAQNTACTDDVRPGVQINVVDQSTQSPINCGLVITAEEGEFSETVETDSTSCDNTTAVNMVYERQGFYTLTISKQGYQDTVIDEVGVADGLCHVFTRDLTVAMIAE